MGGRSKQTLPQSREYMGTPRAICKYSIIAGQVRKKRKIREERRIKGRRERDERK